MGRVCILYHPPVGRRGHFGRARNQNQAVLDYRFEQRLRGLELQSGAQRNDYLGGVMPKWQSEWSGHSSVV